jgi:hypothetical protein
MDMKPLIQMIEDSRAQLSKISETGMGYYIVSGILEGESTSRVYIIGGDFFVVPVEDSKYFSIGELLEKGKLPTNPDEVLSIKLPKAEEPQLATTKVAFPPGYAPAFGSIPLLGTTTLKFPTNLYRFIGSASDPRFDGTNLRSGTFLTTDNDHNYANTGFAAVGRYALPLPVPASQVFIYQLQQGTTLSVGTVLPNYGQAGGGVEVQLQAPTPATLIKHLTLDDF